MRQTALLEKAEGVRVLEKAEGFRVLETLSFCSRVLQTLGACRTQLAV